MTRHVRTSPGAAYDLGYHDSHHLRAEFSHLRTRPPTLWSRSHFVTTVGAVSADTVRRCIETQDERPSKGGGRA